VSEGNVPMKIILVIGVSVLFAAAVSAEYNPATGEDDIVFIGEAQEVRMGKSLAKQVEKKFGLTQDAGIQKRVSDIGQKIAAICDRPQLTYSFRVIEGEELEEEQRYNAFALPGGYVYIFRDMVEDFESDDQLASVIAHEVGHIVAKHGIKKLQGSIGLSGLGLIGAVARADSRSQAKSSYAIAQLMMAHNRKAEFEADKLSVKYLKKAGFDPNAASAFVDRMLEKQLKGKVRRYRYFRTHPHTSERKAMLNKEIGGRFDFDDYINTTEETEEAFK